MSATRADIASVVAVPPGPQPCWLRAAQNPDLPRVLVVSASSLVRFRLRRELQSRGFCVNEASELTGPAVVRAALGVDAVLVDAAPTSSPCRYMLRSLRTDAATERVPVLLLTADSPAVRQELLAVGADGLVPQNEDFDAIAATLSLHLR